MSRDILYLREDPPDTGPWRLYGFVALPDVEPVPIWFNTDVGQGRFVASFAPWDDPDVEFVPSERVLASPYFVRPEFMPEPPVPDALLNPDPALFDK